LTRDDLPAPEGATTMKSWQPDSDMGRADGRLALMDVALWALAAPRRGARNSFEILHLFAHLFDQ
jgi:hypothetical protein